MIFFLEMMESMEGPVELDYCVPVPVRFNDHQTGTMKSTDSYLNNNNNNNNNNNTKEST